MEHNNQADMGKKTELQLKVASIDPSIKQTIVLASLTYKRITKQKNFMRVEHDSAETLYTCFNTCGILVEYTTEPEMSGVKRHHLQGNCHGR